MKNIHVLPTEEPSRLCLDSKDVLHFAPRSGYTIADGKQHLYITSDEEIKEGDWGLSKLNEVILFGRSYNEKFYKKIILTTDTYLIKDSVQILPDHFLEWFVKNPSCEFVEVNKLCYGALSGFADAGYKIIIPKEEPFKHEFKVLSKEEVMEGRSSAYEFIDFDKKETLEEAAEKYILNNINAFGDFQSFFDDAKWQQEQYSTEEKHIGHTINEFDKTYIKGFNDGAKWQQERSYSEQEVFNILMDFFMEKDRQYKLNPVCVAEWFEKFKKK